MSDISDDKSSVVKFGRDGIVKQGYFFINFGFPMLLYVSRITNGDLVLKCLFFIVVQLLPYIWTQFHNNCNSSSVHGMFLLLK